EDGIRDFHVTGVQTCALPILVGFDADIAREIAADLLGDPELIEFRTLSSGDREQALQDHTVDLVAKTMTITCERKEKVAFSTVRSEERRVGKEWRSWGAVWQE